MPIFACNLFSLQIRHEDLKAECPHLVYAHLTAVSWQSNTANTTSMLNMIRMTHPRLAVS